MDNDGGGVRRQPPPRAANDSCQWREAPAGAFPDRQEASRGLSGETGVGRLVTVCVGGALGSGARYLVASWAAEAFGPGLPMGTILVNLVGSYLIAVVVGLAARTAAVSPNVRVFLTTGVMGGFTTYS